MHNILHEFEFGQMGPLTMELAALEHLKKKKNDVSTFSWLLLI